MPARAVSTLLPPHSPHSPGRTKPTPTLRKRGGWKKGADRWTRSRACSPCGGSHAQTLRPPCPRPSPTPTFSRPPKQSGSSADGPKHLPSPHSTFSRAWAAHRVSRPSLAPQDELTEAAGLPRQQPHGRSPHKSWVLVPETRGKPSSQGESLLMGFLHLLPLASKKLGWQGGDAEGGAPGWLSQKSVGLLILGS